MKNISDIQIGDLYHIPHYQTAMYDFIDAKQDNSALFRRPLLDPDTPFVALELHTLKFETQNNMVLHRIKILTTTGEVGWLSLQDSDICYVFPMTSCDKQL